MAGHVAPEAASGGPIALLRNGDRVLFDISARRLEVKLSSAELAARRATWRAPKPRYATGVMAKYAQLVSSASEGAITGPIKPQQATSNKRQVRRRPTLARKTR